MVEFAVSDALVVFELLGSCVLNSQQAADGFDDGHLHAQANSKERDLPLTGETGRLDLPFNAAIAETARDQNGMALLQVRSRILLLKDFGQYDFGLDADLVGDAAVA